MNKQKDREICVWKTIIASLWMYGLMGLFLIGSMFHARNMLLISKTIPELLFWTTTMLLFAMLFTYFLSSATFYIYKKDTSVVVNEQ